jgi:hypothetical protein
MMAREAMSIDGVHFNATSPEPSLAAIGQLSEFHARPLVVGVDTLSLAERGR